jgi:hypothetical protein
MIILLYELGGKATISHAMATTMLIQMLDDLEAAFIREALVMDFTRKICKYFQRKNERILLTATCKHNNGIKWRCNNSKTIRISKNAFSQSQSRNRLDVAYRDCVS